MRWTTVLAFVAAAAVGGLCLRHGFGFMEGFNTSPLPRLTALAAPAQTQPPPVVGPAPGRVMLVVVDGMRADFLHELGLPAPAASCLLESVLPSFSRPAYVALSSGLPPWASGVHTNDHEGAFPLPSIWQVAHERGIATHLVADGTDWWVELFPGAFEHIHMIAKRDFGAFWNTFQMPPRGTLLLLHIVDADDQAHDFGTGEAYVRALRGAGQVIERLLAGMDPTRDTLFVTADHGHIARGGHGGPEPEVLAVPLAAYGAGVIPTTLDVSPSAAAPSLTPAGTPPWCGSLVDLPATLAARLGIEPPRTSLGSVLPLVRPLGSDHGAAAMLAQSVAVHDALGPPGRDPFAQERARPRSLRAVVVGVALWLVFAWLVARMLVAGARGRAVLSALIAPALFATIYMIVEPTLSLSAVWLEDPWTVRVGAIALASGAAASWLVLRRHPPDEALALIATGAALPFVMAACAHGSLAAGPVLGDPYAAFGLIVADLFAGTTAGIAVLATLAALVVQRARGRDKVWV